MHVVTRDDHAITTYKSMYNVGYGNNSPNVLSNSSADSI